MIFCSANKLTLGSSVAITGSLRTARTQTELHPDAIEIIGSCDSVVSTVLLLLAHGLELRCVNRSIHSKLMDDIH